MSLYNNKFYWKKLICKFLFKIFDLMVNYNHIYYISYEIHSYKHMINGYT